MEMHQIRYFLATCKTLNFTRAAEISHVSQPALTKAIKLLEEELGGALFNRQLRPLRLTALGERLHEKFSALHDIAGEIKAEASYFARHESANVALGIINTLGDERMLALVEALRKSAPGIDISVHYSAQTGLISALREGAIEMAVIADCAESDDRFEYFPLYSEDYFLAAPRDHPLARTGAARLEDLHGVSYVHRVHCELNDRVDAMLNERQIQVVTQLFTDQDDLARRMIGAGLGVSILPASICVGDFVKCALVDDPIRRAVSLACLKGVDLSPAGEKMKSALVAYYER